MRPNTQQHRRWIWALIALAALQRAVLLLQFGFTHIGIDDALMQQVAIDYGHGTFREPFLYGQNYNPALEALLAAPFIRMGGAPWVVLPIITSLLALLPFWSWALWAQRRGALLSAMVLASAPLVLPVEWGMITSMPRGWVHGLALLAFIPWVADARSAWVRHGLIALTLTAALLCNPNAAPLVVGIVLWLMLREGRSAALWVTGAAAIAFGWLLHRAAQAWYAARPGSVVHPLLPSDMAFDPALLATGLARINEHLLHLHPFGEMGWLVFVLLLAATSWLLRRGEWRFALAVTVALAVMFAALGIPKAHEGCASIFFPLSRLMLGLPLILAAALAWTLHEVRLRRWACWSIPAVAALTSIVGCARLDGAVEHELATQSCAWVREEPIGAVRERCELLNGIGEEHGIDVIVPIRWPHLRVDHRTHFQAHFTCYACPVLADFVPVAGIGYDRRSWIRKEFGGLYSGRVLFVGGDPTSWQRVLREGGNLQPVPLASEVLHIMDCDSARLAEIILGFGVDDDLAR